MTELWFTNERSGKMLGELGCTESGHGCEGQRWGFENWNGIFD
jgi:hypothetical protein